MNSLSRLTLFLCFAWAGSLLYGEMVAYWVPIWTCSWPHPSSSSLRMVDKSNPDRRMNVAVLADSQLMDRTSLGLAPNSLALEAAQFYTDIYMRRSFLSSILPLKPDLILFLGDQFDGGPFLSDQEWQQSVNRFRHIFNGRKQGRSSDIPVFYLSGNHDIGYSAFHSQHPEVISRFEKEFGKRNYVFTVQEADFIVVDAQTLDGPREGNFTSLTWDLVRSISKGTTHNVRVLLSHIPLYRADGTACGPYRSSQIINQRIRRSASDRGITYQNYLTEETSKHLLDLIRPVIVLSGHDHDHCTVTHSTSFGPVIEHTLGTVSWQQGNLYPSFMLLSVSPPNTSAHENQVSTDLCFLPMQTHIYLWYLSLFVITLLASLFWPTNGIKWWDGCVQLVKSFLATSKEKDEDENYDYEMIWDAEGSMHLVKKAAAKVPNTSKNDSGLMARGTVVARPAAKKQASPEADSSISVDMNAADAKLDNRADRSMARKVIQRLLRASRVVMIVAIINLPLYMMLLFKDWIER